MLALRSSFVVIVAALLAGTAGCKKSKPGPADQTAPVTEQSSPTAENKGPAPLRGAAEVTAALQRKDYPGAVGALAQVKAGITPDQRNDYNELMAKVREAVGEARAKDESAQRAYQALRMLETGR
jgi:hypothetical protein